jgi:peroxiredoxin
MPIVESSMLMELGNRMPEFKLPEVHGASIIANDFFDGADGSLVAFICRHCPYVQHMQEGLADFAREYEQRNLITVGICSSDVEQYSADDIEGLKEQVQEIGFNFPYLVDEGQEVAKAFSAMCTPDLFLFDGEGRLVYRGQFDDSRPKSAIGVTGSDLRAAADAVLDGGDVSGDQKPSSGCNVAWKPGNEPDYYLG